MKTGKCVRIWCWALIIGGVFFMGSPTLAARWIVEEGESCQIGGSNVFETVSIGANAKVGLMGDTVIVVTGSDDPGPAFYMGTGSTVYAAMEIPWSEAVDGAEGTNGASGQTGSWSNFVYFPHNPPTYYPPDFIDGEDGEIGGDAVPAAPHARFPNLMIRVDGDVVLDYESSILLHAFDDWGSGYAVDGGNGGAGGDGGNGGAYEAFATSGPLDEPYYVYAFYSYDGGDGGAGGAAGKAANGMPGPAGGELRLHALGNMHLGGWVEISASGCEGGDGGHAADGGFPGTAHYGQHESGEYKDFGANGIAGNGANGGAGGLVDLFAAGNISAAPPANYVFAYGGGGGSGGRGSDCAYHYYGHARLHVPPPAMTAAGKAAGGGDGGAVRIRAGRFIGEAEGSGDGSGACYVWCGASGGSGGRGGDLGYNWGLNDEGHGIATFPGDAEDGMHGGAGGSVILEAGSGVYCAVLLAASNGGEGGDGGFGGDVGGTGYESFYVSGGNGGNGGAGGEVVFHSPFVGNGTNLFLIDGGMAGTNGVGTHGEGPSGVVGVEGAGGSVVTQLVFYAFPMTLDITSVPEDLAGAVSGDTISYHCTFTNDSLLAISDCVLRSDPLPGICEPVPGSAGSTGFWDASAGQFETPPQFIAAGQTIELDFSVQIVGATSSGTELINGVEATGLFNGGVELDHDLHALPLGEGLVAHIDAPRNGSVFIDSESVSFIGVVSGVATGVATGVVWHSDRDGQLGDAPSIDALLSSGAHQIDFHAVSADGRTNISSVAITVLADGNADGLPDSWAAIYWPAGGSGGAQGDPDGDGLNNFSEWVAGTIPTNPASCLCLSEIKSHDTVCSLSWGGVSNYSYRVLWAPDMMEPFTPLETIDAPGTSNVVNFTDHAHPSHPQGFYTIQVVR